MAKLPVVKGDDAIKAFEGAGFYLDHWSGGHAILCHPDGRHSAFLVGEKNSSQAPCEP